MLSLAFIIYSLTAIINGQSNQYPNRPVFHFVPVPIGHMNDPNGPFYDPDTGKYHLMFQYYTPRQWGHAISDDLLRWYNLPIAIPNNTSYNKGGVFTGSTTVLPNAIGGYKKYITYSVNTNNMMCIAWPTDPTDVNLTDWTNDPDNCVLVAGQNGVPNGRDPTTSWPSPDGKTWTFTWTAKIAYQTTDWRTWKRGPGTVFKTPGGIECPDFYQLPKAQQFPGATHVVKVSMGGQDWWTFGTYNDSNTLFTPYPSAPYNQTNRDGLCDSCLFDHGKSWYAAKSFYDNKNDRQVIFAWFKEQTGQNNNHWDGTQSLPRTITLLTAQQSPTGYPRIISYPIKEFDSLRIQSTKFTLTNQVINAGQNMIFDATKIAGNELDIELTFGSSPNAECGIYVNGNGAASDKLGTTYTRIGVGFNSSMSYYVQPNGQAATSVVVPGWNGNDAIKIRIIVDHSIVTAFINDGIVSTTRRVYQHLPTFTIGAYAVKAKCMISLLNGYNVTHVIQPAPN